MGLFTKKKKEEKKVAAKPVVEKKSAAPKATAKKADTKKPVAAKKAASKKTDTGNAYQVLLRPIITEKTTRLSKEGKYTFEVSLRTNKIEIKSAIRSVYGVEPTDVTVMRILGKPIRNRYGKGRRKNWRKATVTLKKGQSIEVFSTKQ